MASGDLRPFRSPEGGVDLKFAPMAASASFLDGEVLVYSSGAVTEGTSDPSSVAGIAASRATDPNSRFPRATGTLIQIYDTDGDERFRTKNFATDGAGTSATPTQANAIGQLAGLTLASSTWYVDTGAANLHVFIEDVLDSRGNSLSDPLANVGTGVEVVFRFV